MLENHSDTANVKRYAPPQRNRVLNRRKSGDGFERSINSFGNDEEKSQFTPARNIPAIDHGEAGSSNLNVNPHPRLIPIHGCSGSQAAQLLNERWGAAMDSYSDPSIDLSEKPVMYSGASGLPWGHAKLSPQMDFLAELRRAIRSANASTTTLADHS